MERIRIYSKIQKIQSKAKNIKEISLYLNINMIKVVNKIYSLIIYKDQTLFKGEED